MKTIFDNGKAKVIETDRGTYVVSWEGVANFDGFVEVTTYSEVFAEDGIHSGGGVCRHNKMLQYPNDGKSIKERAIDFAKGI